MKNVTTIACFLAVLVAAAQETSVAQPARRNASVYLNQLDFSRYPRVDLYATVVDRDRESVPLNLGDTTWMSVVHKNFPAGLNDVQSVIDLKRRGESELYIAMVFDNSASMEGRNALLETAATQFIDSLKAGDYVALVDFGDGRRTVSIPEFQKPVYARLRSPFSNSKPFLRKNLKTGIMTQRTFLNDGLMFGLSTLNGANVLGRKAVILFSDGEDNGSETGLDQVRHALASYNIPVYAIDLNSVENKILKDLALSSGGEYFFVKRASDLQSLYQTVLKILKSQYRITYNSPESTISGDAYPVRFALAGSFVAQAQRTFMVDGENIGFYNLAYLESIGKESLRNYMDYLSGFPRSKHADQVLLKIGRFWQQRGEYAKALSVFNIILRNPTSSVYSDALLEKADLYKAAKQYHVAQQAYTQVLNSQVSGSVRARALLELAKSYTAEGNFAMALNTYSTLSSQYEGTELASEAFLQAATLSMEMGDLPAAAKSLQEVVTNYGESKSAVYARMELARIAETEQRGTDAIELYKEVLSSNVDSDIKEDISLKLARLFKETGRLTEAAEMYKGIMSTSSSIVNVYTCQQELVPLLLMSGRIMEARSLYESLTPTARSDLAEHNPSIPVSVSGQNGTSLPNGAYVLHSAPSTGAGSLRTVEWPEALQKFAVVGPLYAMEAVGAGSKASLPVEESWISRSAVVPGTAGVYHFENGNWTPVTKALKVETRSYEFAPSKPGVYALLAKEPRVIRLFNIYFDLGKAEVRKEAEQNLYEIIDAMKALTDVRLEIAGHTDATGREDENIDLSSRRANAIRDFMIQNGVAAGRLIARGYGSQYPIAPNDSPENLQKNRRSEFTIISTIADPVRKSTGETVRYTVLLKSFRSPKDAYEAKKVYQGLDLPVAIVTNDEKRSERYELTLGTYAQENEAMSVIERFRKEFKNIEPTIVKSNRSR
ncbi:MAG TPA: OmpA family protein [Bacteroidota bacterium]|nr:OmpA family protein [Bacteroidota bacterium]